MEGLKVVVLAGTLSDDPEVRPMPSGDQVTRFRLHVPEPRKRVLPVSVWERSARRACQGLGRGDAVLVRGHLVRRFYRDGSGDGP
ncbi:MAG TPA: single-stranded DNA-binding protein [Actinomycetota bacterium]|nr:single-stranded DNA-binding protein [Actinomycetota bacterium]